MARVELIADENAGVAAAAALAEVALNRGTVSNFARTLAHLPDALTAFEQMSAAVRHAPLSDTLRELIVLRVAVVRANEYEWRRHARAALGYGLTGAQVAGIGDWVTADCYGEDERAVLALVDAHLFHSVVDDATLAAVRDRLGSPATVAVCLAMGWYLLCTAVMLSLDLAADDPVPPAPIARPPVPAAPSVRPPVPADSSVRPSVPADPSQLRRPV